MSSLPATDFRLWRDALGTLMLTQADGTTHAGVQPVRAFPLSAPEQGLSLVGPDGHELVWIDRLDRLPDDLRTLINDELAPREFMPAIQHVREVSTFATPCTWTVDTDRGPTQFVLKTEDDIRRLPDGRLLLHSAQGLTFCIANPASLDRHSRRLLERFL